jgi:hypothetical protein
MCLLTNEESLNEPSIQVAYNSLLPILPIHEKLLETLRERIQNWHPDQEVAGIFLKFVCARIIVRTHAVFSSLSLSLSLSQTNMCSFIVTFVQGPLFRNYSKFVSEYNEVLTAVDNCMGKSIRFAEFVNVCLLARSFVRMYSKVIGPYNLIV